MVTDGASIADSRLGRFAAWASARRGLSVGDPVDYDALWTWSVQHLDQLSADVAPWFDVWPGEDPVRDDEVLRDRQMPGATWFPERKINVTKLALRYADPNTPALIAVDEYGT